MSVASSNAWVAVNADNSYEIFPNSFSASTQAVENMTAKVNGEGGPFAVCNHLVTDGVWMWYRYYNAGVAPETCDRVNHCATALWSFKVPEWQDKRVYGPVAFAGSIGGAPLTPDNLARLILIARLAKTEAEKLETVK